MENFLNPGGIFGPEPPKPKSRDELIALRNKLRERELQQAIASGVFRSASILTTTRACPACQQLDGKRMSLSEVLRTQPLPCPDCTTVLYNGWRNVCRCTYLFHDEEA
jgi:hypothetical protein